MSNDKNEQYQKMLDRLSGRDPLTYEEFMAIHRSRINYHGTACNPRHSSGQNNERVLSAYERRVLQNNQNDPQQQRMERDMLRSAKKTH